MKNHRHFPKKFSHHALVVFLLLITGFTACIKEDDFRHLKNINLPTWNPSIAAPIGGVTLTLSDLLDRAGDIDILHEDPDGFLWIYHRSTLLSEYAGELIKFDRQEQDTTVQVFFPLYLPVGDSLSFGYAFHQTFSNVENDVVDSIRFKQGIFALELESMMNHDAKIILTSPYITKNNVPLRIVADLDYQGGLPVTATAQFSLDGYSFVFDHAGSQNNLGFFVEVRVFGDQNPGAGPFPVKISVAQDQLAYRALFGQIKTRTMALLSDTIVISLFENGLGGNFHINDPRIGIHFTNSFGIPIAITLDPLKGHSDVNPPYDVQLSGPGLPVPFILNAPTIAQIGQKAHSSLVLNKQNSNIDDFINLIPQKVVYGVEGTINPTGVSTGNFVLDTSSFTVDLELEIPLEGYASGFSLGDTIEFSFDEDVEMVEWILFRVNAESTFPVEASIQVMFLDSVFNAIDSLFDQSTVIVPGAIPGPPPGYKPISPTFRSIDIKADHAKLKKISGVARHILLTGRINTAGGGNQVVRIYSDNYLKLDIGVQGKLKIEPPKG
jgi:hypothetical protein